VPDQARPAVKAHLQRITGAASRATAERKRRAFHLAQESLRVQTAKLVAGDFASHVADFWGDGRVGVFGQLRHAFEDWPPRPPRRPRRRA